MSGLRNTALRTEFDPATAEGYRSATQRARRLSEDWFAREMYCVVCGATDLWREPNNSVHADFRCVGCEAGFELKSSGRPFGAIVPDGAYPSMIERLQRRGGGPHLALLEYCRETWAVRCLAVIPSMLLTPSAILPRRPLGPGARRAGWVGCNIRIADIPASGRVAVIEAGIAVPKTSVLARVARFTPIGGELAARSWLVETLACVERLPDEFSLAQLFASEHALRTRFPGNQHIRDKLRQQLQRLRDRGFVEFLGEGRYRRVAG